MTTTASVLSDLDHEVRGCGPPVLLISGGDGDAGYFARTAQQLADEFTTVAYDRRGCSRSARLAEGEPISIAAHADDAVALIEQLELAPAIVFGTSAGAVIALELVARHPSALRAAIVHEPDLVAVNPDSEADAEELQPILSHPSERAMTTRVRARLAVLALAAPLGPAPAPAAERSEYTPRSHSLPASGVCRSGFELNTEGNGASGPVSRCVRKCRARHVLLAEIRFVPPRLSCVPTRPSRLLYRAQLDADFSSEHTTQPVSGGQTTHVRAQRWRFRSSGAAVVFRRCAVLASGIIDPEEAALLVGLPSDAGRMPCARVGRGIGAELVEDTSFGYRGVIVGAATTASSWCTRVRSPITCAGPTASSARTSWSSAPGRSSRPTRAKGHAAGPRWSARSTARAASAGWPSTATRRRSSPARGCGRRTRSPVPRLRAINPKAGDREAASGSRGVPEPIGRDLADRFTPNLARQYGKPTMTANRTVRRSLTLPQINGVATDVATFTLTLTRCPDKGRDPRPC